MTERGSIMTIPDLQDDGYLPVGVHLASTSEIIDRFGTTTPIRRRLALRLTRWIDLCRDVQARRMLVDGSFVTATPHPNDVDAVVWLTDDFVDRVARGEIAAIELETILLTRRPEDLFAAEDLRDWNDWASFFSRTREEDGRRKGILEVEF